METYLSFVIIAYFCAVVVALFIMIMSDYDLKTEPSYKTSTILFIITLAIAGSNGYFNYTRSRAIQKKIIKECYYKGVSVKVNKLLKLPVMVS